MKTFFYCLTSQIFERGTCILDVMDYVSKIKAKDIKICQTKGNIINENFNLVLKIFIVGKFYNRKSPLD